MDALGWPQITVSTVGIVPGIDALTATGLNNHLAYRLRSPKSKNPLTYKRYNPAEVIEVKTMAEHLHFSIVYRHTMCGRGADMFGAAAVIRPWKAGLSGLDPAKAHVPVFFEIAGKIGMPYYAFQDRDVAPHGKTLRESNEWSDTIVALLKEEQKRTGIKLLPMRKSSLQ